MTLSFAIKGFAGYYVTDSGDVYYRDTHPRHNGRIKKMKQELARNGYARIGLRYGEDKSQSKHFLVHRLVAEAFIPKQNGKDEVNHKNGIKTDNRVENLEWVNHSGNMQHRSKVLGFRGNPTWKGKKGAQHPLSKIVLQIKNGVVIKEYFGTLEAERATGISHSNISVCCSGRRKTAGGYEWAYKQ